MAYMISPFFAKITISEQVRSDKKFFQSDLVNVYNTDFPSYLNIDGGTAFGKIDADIIWDGETPYRLMIKTSGFTHDEGRDKIEAENFFVALHNITDEYISLKQDDWTIIVDNRPHDKDIEEIFFKVNYPDHLYAGNYSATSEVKIESVVDEETYISEQSQLLF